MNTSPDVRRLGDLLRSPAVASAYTLAAIGAVFTTYLLRQLMGDAGYGAVISGLLVLGVAILAARRQEWQLRHLAPWSLVLVLAWFLLSFLWSSARGATISGWIALAASALVAVTVAHIRDTVQIVRATGDVLRVLLVLSLGMEILSGILLDLPIPFLGIAGDITAGGPIQGIFGSRTQLGVVTIIALVTFLVEWRTRSVATGLSVFSITLGALLAVLTASPIVWILALLSATGAGILVIARRIAPSRRRTFHTIVASLVSVGLLTIYLFRRPLVYWLNAEPGFLERSRLWNVVLDFAEREPIAGWGWVGTWPSDRAPYVVIHILNERDQTSALGAYMDVLLQTGGVGAALFAFFGLLALGRSWVSASERRSTVYTWAPLVILVVLADGVVTSALLGGFEWFLLVVCAARASLMRWDSPDPPGATPTGIVTLPPGPRG